MNDYYDVSIKEYRLEQIENMISKSKKSTWKFVKGSIADKGMIDEIFEKYKPSIVVNLAAQAGVRYSITNPDVYIESNLIGFITFWKRAVIPMTMEKRESSIWFMLLIICIWKQ